MDEALAGVKGELAIKLYGPDIFVMDAKAKEVANVLRGIRGVADLDYDHLTGQPSSRSWSIAPRHHAMGSMSRTCRTRSKPRRRAAW